MGTGIKKVKTEIIMLLSTIKPMPVSATIKRQWGFYYIITKKGIKHASADAGFMFVAYNLRRLMNIIDTRIFTKFLRELAFSFFKKLVLPKRFIFKITYSFFRKMF